MLGRQGGKDSLALVQVDISGIVRTDSSYDTIPADLEHRRLLVNGIPINYLSRWLP